MVFEIFLESLFTGRVIFMILLGVVAGYITGWSRLGPVGVVGAGLVILFIQMVLFSTSDYIRTLTYIGQTGAAGFEVGDVFVLHFIFHPLVLAIGVLLGLKARSIHDENLHAEVDGLTGEDMEKTLRVLGSHPDLAQAGWFARRWNVMDAPKRARWISAHMDDLKELLIEADGEGLKAFGKDLPQRLAEIDKGDI